MINKAQKKATATILPKVMIGIGMGNSARSGAKIVEILAEALQIPKAVPAKMAGKRSELER